MEAIPVTFSIPARLIEIIDGDTLAIELRQRWLVRIDGIDTPELHVPAQAKAAGVVRDAAAWWLAHSAGVPHVAADHHDKYGGRVLGAITTDQGGLATWLLARRLAKPYAGGTKTHWTDEELRVIEAQAGQFDGFVRAGAHAVIRAEG